MLQNAYLLAKIVADTAENERHFAEILPETAAAPLFRPGDGRRRTSGKARTAGRMPRLRSPGLLIQNSTTRAWVGRG